MAMSAALTPFRLRFFADDIHEPEGKFFVTPARKDNHGPVRAEGVRLHYDDGTPYYSVGTTCYAWLAQTLELQEQTLDTLRYNASILTVVPSHEVLEED